MKNVFLLPIIIFLSCSAKVSEKDVKHEILEIMKMQEKAWNNYDLEGYMQAYWNSDSLRFIGSKGLNYGWQTTLTNYKKSYPDKAAMGKLQFDIISIEKLEKYHALVIGKWTIFRSDTISGYYTLIWRRIDDDWKIIADHSS